MTRAVLVAMRTQRASEGTGGVTRWPRPASVTCAVGLVWRGSQVPVSYERAGVARSKLGPVSIAVTGRGRQ